MDNGKWYQEKNVLTCKKKRDRDQSNDNKKKKKNKRHKDKNNTHQSITPMNSQSKKPKQHIYFTDLCQMFGQIQPNLIKNYLEITDYDKQAAIDLIHGIMDDQSKEQIKSDGKKRRELIDNVSTNSPSEKNAVSEKIGYQILNEMYDLHEEINLNGEEFAQLFEEMSRMIEKEKTLCTSEIFNIIDDPDNLVMNFIEGFHHEDDYINAQELKKLKQETQKYLWKLLLDNSKKMKQKEQEFPVLGSNSEDKLNIIQKIHNQYEEDQLPPSSNAPLFNNVNQHGLCNVDNRHRSQADMKFLMREYNDMSLSSLKFIYFRLQGDLYNCRQFLKQYYPHRRLEIKQIDRTNHRNHENKQKRIFKDLIPKQTIDEQLRHMTLMEIREELEHYFKLRQTFNITKYKINNNKQKAELNRLSNSNLPIINKLIATYRIKLVDEAIHSKDPLYIDLHYCRLEEIDAILHLFISQVKRLYDQGNQKIITRKFNFKTFATLTVMTGKGQGSIGGKSVLKPAVEEWAKRNGFHCIVTEDRVQITVKMN